MSDRWQEAMRRGDFEAAWRVSDAVLAARRSARTDCRAWPRHLQFLWDGTPPDGRDVLVHCYHGLGDTLQFVRLLPRLRERARRVTLWVQPALQPLLARAAGADAVLPLHDGPPPAGHELHVELMELPHLLRLQVAGIPADVPYLAAPGPAAAGADAVRPRHAAPRVGIAWQSGDWDASRSIPPAALAPLRDVRGIEAVSLQHRLAPPPWMADGARHDDLPALARRIAALEAVVTVDTLVAHLAGALAVPTLLLLPEPADWRWMTGRNDSPWYPTLRLLRQRRPGDWTAPVASAARACSQLACGDCVWWPTPRRA